MGVGFEAAGWGVLRLNNRAILSIKLLSRSSNVIFAYVFCAACMTVKPLLLEDDASMGAEQGIPHLPDNDGRVLPEGKLKFL